MAVLSINPLCHSPVLVGSTRSESSRIMVTRVSCQNQNGDPNSSPSKVKANKEENNKGVLMMLQQFIGGVEKLGKGVKDNLSPKQKGDWKDLTLMSLSFAVYVYMSQKIVCAYCVWMSMSRQPW